MDPAMIAATFGLVGAMCAAVWSFLMAKYVAGPRAKELMVGTLKGTTARDKEIVGEIREQLIRPELITATVAIKADVCAIRDQVAAIRIPELPTFDVSRLEAQIAALKGDVDLSEIISGIDDIRGTIREVPDMIARETTTHIDMALKQYRAQETKALQDMLNAADLDGAIEKMGAEAQQQLIQQMSLGQQAALKIANLQPSKKWEKEHPFGTAGLELYKANCMQVMAQMQGVGVIGGNGSSPAGAHGTGREYVRGLILR